MYKRSLKTNHTLIFVLDDETYVPLDPSQVTGNEFYNQVDTLDTPADHKLKRKEKFTKKYLVWQAISSNGHASEPFISTGTITGQVYREECIKRLKKFLGTLGDKSNILFWPDMASSHYEKSVIAELERHGIQYATKNENTPNCPQIRPIERYWALCKAKYGELTTVCKSKKSFMYRWKKISSEVLCNSLENIFTNFLSKLAKVGKFGVDSVQ